MPAAIILLLSSDTDSIPQNIKGIQSPDVAMQNMGQHAHSLRLPLLLRSEGSAEAEALLGKGAVLDLFLFSTHQQSDTLVNTSNNPR